MFSSKYASNRSPSISSQQNRSQSPNQSDYEYVGRLVTRERPIISKSKSIHQNVVYPSNTDKYEHSSRSDRQNIYEEIPVRSSDDDGSDDDLSRPLGVIKISDRHFREIYRLPTPPPKVKRVYHRLRSPEPKIIERVYVRRPAPQIIENIIEVPPEKVKIIKREKFLEKSKPITRSKVIRLKSDDDQGEYGYEPQQRDVFIPANQSNLQQTTNSAGSTTTLVYPPQPNARTIGYIKSTIPPHIMLNSQQNSINQTTQPTLLNAPPAQTPVYQTLQPAGSPYNPPVATPQTTNYQLLQPSPYNPSIATPQTTNYQLLQSSPYSPAPPQTTTTYQMAQPTTYVQAPQQATPYIYPTTPNIYGYQKY